MPLQSSYNTVTLTLPSPDWEICEGLLSERCLSVSAFMKPSDSSLWTLIGIMEAEKVGSFKESFFQEALERGVYIHPEDLEIAPLQTTDWLHQISLDFPAFTVENFWIHGTHIAHNPPPNHIELIINAATAFGSGEHETTKGCLHLLNKLFSTGKIPLQFPRVLDMGTGSGILLIAFVKLLLSQVSPSSLSPFLLGVDNDPGALTVSYENAQLNGVCEFLSFKQSHGFETIGPYHESFDVIFANIVLGPLKTLCLEFFKALKPEGFLILSGLLHAQLEEVTQLYRPFGFEVTESKVLGEWVSILMQKKLSLKNS